MAIKIHWSSLFTCRPLGLGSFPAVFLARILVLPPGAPPPLFELFIFRFVVRLVSRLSRGAVSENKSIT